MERHCKNCNKMLYVGHHYCPNCGSKWVDYRLTPRKITVEFSNRYLGTDNKFLATLIGLIRLPEDVINGYITGQRKRYVNPASFYFISLTLIGLQIFILRHFAPESLAVNNINNNVSTTVMDTFYDYIGFFTTVFLPCYAITSYLIFLNIKKYNLTEHFIVSIYIFGFINILTFLLTPLVIFLDINYSATSIFLTPLVIFQFAWYYKRCLQLTIGETILKGLIAFILSGIVFLVYSLVLICLVAGVIFFMNPELLNNINITTT